MRKIFRNILLAVLAASLIIGVPLVIISHSTSPYKVLERSSVQVIYNTNYEYLAHVNNSIIYNNRNTIGMNDPLYIPLTKTLEFNMTFNTISKLDKIVENKGIIDLKIKLTEPNGWSILLNNTTYVIDAPNTMVRFNINVTELRRIIASIRKEIGLSSLEYNIEIDPTIKVSTKLSNRIVDRIVEPKLVLSLDFQRNKILYDNLNFTDTYKRSDKQIIPSTFSMAGLFSLTIQNLRYISYTLILVGVMSAILIMITREKALTSVVDGFLRKYDSVIIRASAVTSSSRKVLVRDFRELLRISRLLGKPIVYYKDGESHVFTVIDAETLYILSLSEDGKPLSD